MARVLKLIHTALLAANILVTSPGALNAADLNGGAHEPAADDSEA